MKRAIFSVLAVVVLVGLTGCVTQQAKRSACTNGCCPQVAENGQAADGENCPDPGRAHVCRLCGGHGCPLCCGRGEAEGVNPGPATGAIDYPYYTNRSPRDFLAKSPASIGP